MSEDPRYVEPRCGEFVSTNMLQRQDFRCEFRAGHAGLHSAGTLLVQGGPYEPKPCEPMRWGSEAQLAQEIELREPDGIITISGDVTTDLAEAIRKAFRRGGAA